jgi:hypothetical protein
MIRAVGSQCKPTGDDMKAQPAIQDVTAPVSSVVAFPDARRTALVRRAARELDRVASDDVAVDLVCDGLADEMRARLAALGMDEDAQDEAVGAFFIAVDAAREEPTDSQTCLCCANTPI